MRRCCKYFCALFIPLIFLDPVLSAQKASSWRTVETFTFDWNGRGRSRFTVQSPQEPTSAGEYIRIRIQVPGEKEFSLKDEDGLVSPFDKEGWVPPRLLKESRAISDSRKILFLRESSGSDKKSFIALIGYSYGSSPGALWVVRLGETGPPYIALHKKEMGLAAVQDLDADDLREIIGYPCLHQIAGENIETYDPTHVFHFTDRNLEFSLPLTKKYNLQHYVWAGPNCSESVGVQRLPGKSRKLVKIQ